MIQQPHDRAAGATFDDVWAERLSRRQVLTGVAAAMGVVTVGLPTASPGAAATPLRSIQPQTGDRLVLAGDYRHSIVARWGDPLLRRDAGLDTSRLRTIDWLEPAATAAQASRFGTNCDALAYFPLRLTSGGRDVQGLLCVNHEYVNAELVFADYAGRRRSDADSVAARRDWTLAYPESVAWMQA
ncbi:MAG TPA: DUF839 domain-containing protein, partial [Steroidobacteraceae bacterium]|nr:DUF839 domain-containing protein [Steroidobacteraceae bacterium]